MAFSPPSRKFLHVTDMYLFINSFHCLADADNEFLIYTDISRDLNVRMRSYSAVIYPGSATPDVETIFNHWTQHCLTFSRGNKFRVSFLNFNNLLLYWPALAQTP